MYVYIQVLVETDLPYLYIVYIQVLVETGLADLYVYIQSWELYNGGYWD